MERRRRDVARIAGGWAINHLVWTFLLLIFLIYGCHYQRVAAAANASDALMLAWAVSFAQRFVINEPVLITLAVVAPLVAAKYCQWALRDNKVASAVRMAAKELLAELFGDSSQELGEGGVL